VDFRPDGKAVLATPNPGLIAFPSGKVIEKAPAGLAADRFSADGRTLFSGPASTVSTLSSFDARTLRRKGDDLRTGQLAQDANNVPLAHSSDDRLVATAHRESLGAQVDLWNLATRTRLGITLTGHRDDRVLAMAFTPGDASLITVDNDGVFFTYTVGPPLLVAELCKKSGGLGEAEWKARIPDVPYRATC
jgi:WD40 repeat protein